MDNNNIRQEKRTINELALYYAKRYNLSPTDFDAIREEDRYSGYYNVLRRILKSTSIDGKKTLWDKIDLENDSRKISISEFENYYLDKWLKYLKDNCKADVDNINFKNDMERLEKINKVQKDFNDSYIANAEHQESDDYINEKYYSGVSEAEFLETKYYMMLQAIYSIFYQPFKDKQLYEDLNNAVIEDYMLDPNITSEYIAATENLKDWRNYAIRKDTENICIPKEEKNETN